jgi:hypothetical protein
MVCPGYAKLTSEQMKEIQGLEQKHGLILLAHEKVMPFADLSSDRLAQLQKTEKEMGTILIAYKAQ